MNDEEQDKQQVEIPTMEIIAIAMPQPVPVVMSVGKDRRWPEATVLKVETVHGTFLFMVDPTAARQVGAALISGANAQGSDNQRRIELAKVVPPKDLRG